MAGFKVQDAKKEEEALSLPDSDLVGILDIDYVKYSVASAGEKRHIKVTHQASGKEILNTITEVIDGKEIQDKAPFKTRTEFWGRGKKIGGYLAGVNGRLVEQGKEELTKEDFLVQDVQVAESLDKVLYSAKTNVMSALKRAGVGSYEGYIGKGTSFREGVSTLQKYKDRANVMKPLLLDDVTDYLETKFDCDIITGIEADDMVVIRAYGDDKAVIIGEDKDYRGQPILYYDVNAPEEGIINGDCLGKLTATKKASYTKYSGYGRLFLYFQMISEDSIDCYKASYASEVRWGQGSAYKALVGCESEEEALRVVIDTFKTLYPKPFELTTWRGNTITADWYYVANEMFQMARMQRWVGDIMSFDAWCHEKGVMFDG